MTGGPTKCQRLQGWLEGDGITGQWFGLRSALSDRGVDPFAIWTGEVFRNFDGGLQTRTDWTGLLEFGTNVDLEKALEWNAAKFHVSALWLQGNDDSSTEYVGSFDEISNIAGKANIRIFQLYLSQQFGDGTFRFKIGQLALDEDFMISKDSSLFINASLGALPVQSVNTRAPIYPLAALGAYTKWLPRKGLSIALAAYGGDAGTEKSNRHGFDYDFGSSEGVIVLSELAIDAAPLGHDATFKIGGYYASGDRTNYETGNESSGRFAIYLVIDQILVGTRSENHLAAFFRLGWSPLEDRSQVYLYFDGGLTARGFRKFDRVGLAVSHAEFGKYLVDTKAAEGSPIVDDGTTIELTYRAQLTPWFVLQPDFQYLIDPQNAAASDAVVAGVRAEIAF